MTAEAVAGANAGRPAIRRPALRGFAPSTSFDRGRAETSTSARTPPGSGLWRMMPCTPLVGGKTRQLSTDVGLGSVSAEVDKYCRNAGLLGCLHKGANIPSCRLVVGRNHQGERRLSAAVPQCIDVSGNLGTNVRRKLLAIQQGGHRRNFSRTAPTTWLAASIAVSSSLMIESSRSVSVPS